jgi:hypothetical protein
MGSVTLVTVALIVVVMFAPGPLAERPETGASRGRPV